jgi:translation initiation factor 2 subunit 3
MTTLNNQEIFHKQPNVIIGLIGAPANGKSSIIKALTGDSTQRHSDELKNNATIRLGYAGAKIFKCPRCPRPECFQATLTSVMNHACRLCNSMAELVTHFSFCDNPGHADYLSTMLNGARIMDYGILVESVTNTTVPEFQTVRHFEIAKELDIPIPLICLNKLDRMLKNKNEIPAIVDKIEKFVAQYQTDKIPMLPISGTMGYNMDILCEYIASLPPKPKNTNADSKMLIARSFNINKEKTPISNIRGGTIGGTLVRGILKLDDIVIVYPGYIDPETNKCVPLRGKVKSLRSDENDLSFAIPGGMIAVQLDIDSALTGDDKLVGQVVYSANKDDPGVYSEITLKFKQLDKKENFTIGETIHINVNSNNLEAQIKDLNNNITLSLKKPICLEKGDLISLSKKDKDSINICGYGIFETGVEFPILK